MHTVAVYIAALLVTPPLAGLALLGVAFRVRDRPGGLFDHLPRLWARAIVWASGSRVRVHGEARMRTGEPRVYVCNHVSWFDVFSLASVLPRYKFVAKAELARIPIFGPGARAVGTVFIERDNRKRAFGSYQVAAEQIRAGSPVVVYPEGTRGNTYALRPFKKGPFVLAIAAGVPIVPTLIHGTIDIMPRSGWWIRPGSVDIHLLEPIETAGLSYDDRDQLMRLVWRRMADAMRDLYGVESSGAAISVAEGQDAPDERVSSATGR
jgi:1-acyl-sn-glycerol-3-phosphate acyltransferase